MDSRNKTNQKLALTKNMLQKKLYVIFTKPSSDIDLLMSHLDAHLAFQVELEKRGVMFGAGPFLTDDGDMPGDGMVIIRAASLGKAKAIADSDPMHKSGARTYEVRPWILNEGVVSIRFSYSDQKAIFE